MDHAVESLFTDRFLPIDLHMHTTVSDGTDTPEQLLDHVKAAGIRLFSITDHDAIKSSEIISPLLSPGDPWFLPGVEFSCKDEEGKYHILGYGYDPGSKWIRGVVDLGHFYRMEKVRARLDFLKEEFQMDFPQEEIRELLSLNNPGKPHIGNMMVRHGYAASRNEAIKDYIDQLHFTGQYLRPEEAIEGILRSGGIPVLAHPSYGSGDQLILGDDMDRRIRRLMGYGLEGVEAFYSGFSPKLRGEILAIAERYSLNVTAGSDYHGQNKLVVLGDTGIKEGTAIPAGMVDFLHRIREQRLYH